jgi:hypothetical protein
VPKIGFARWRACPVISAWDNAYMSTAERTTVGDLLPGDLEAAERNFIDSTPFEAELARRLDEHTERVSEEIFRERGLIDEATMQMLLDRVPNH